MQQIFNDFHFPRKARIGALALLFVLILLILIWRLLPAIVQPKIDEDEIALQAAWAKFQTENIQTEQSGSKPVYARSHENEETSQPTARQAELFTFDPNTAPEADLLRLGLPKYTVSTILKYRAKNPPAFKKKEDLQKLYTLKKEDYERIVPYVRIGGNTNSQTESHKPAAVPQQSNIIDLNSADAAQLMSLRGIGPAYSKRIIRFRDALGGFLNVEQLKEVYGFHDSTYQQLKGKLRVNTSLINRINLKVADESSLARHPYIGRKLAAAILNLRSDIGQFSDLEQLRQVPLINEEKYRKIAPYLSIR